MVAAICKCCGQSIQQFRAGVKLSPAKCRIFDLIKARPGINRRQLAELLYERVTQAQISTVAAHINQLRGMLESTDITIRATQYSGYFIKKRKV